MDVNTQLEALRLKFIGDLPKRMNAIETSFDEWQSSDNSEHLSEFHRLTHSLTGAAATFGCDEVSVAARALEIQLKAIEQAETGLEGVDLSLINTLLSDVAVNIDKATSQPS